MEATEKKNVVIEEQVNFAEVVSDIFFNQYFTKDGKCAIYEDYSSKVYRSLGIFYSLKNKEQIIDFNVENIDKNRTRVTYTYNRNVNVYPNIVNNTLRKIALLGFEITPMSELVEQKGLDDVDRIDNSGEFDEQTQERVTFKDSTTGQLNQDIKDLADAEMKLRAIKKRKSAA